MLLQLWVHDSHEITVAIMTKMVFPPVHIIETTRSFLDTFCESSYKNTFRRKERATGQEQSPR